MLPTVARTNCWFNPVTRDFSEGKTSLPGIVLQHDKILCICFTNQMDYFGDLHFTKITPQNQTLTIFRGCGELARAAATNLLVMISFSEKEKIILIKISCLTNRYHQPWPKLEVTPKVGSSKVNLLYMFGKNLYLDHFGTVGLDL